MFSGMRERECPGLQDEVLERVVFGSMEKGTKSGELFDWPAPASLALNPRHDRVFGKAKDIRKAGFLCIRVGPLQDPGQARFAFGGFIVNADAVWGLPVTKIFESTANDHLLIEFSPFIG